MRTPPHAPRASAHVPIVAGRAFVLAALVLAGLWLWDVTWLAPLRLLVVLVHETGHALATLAFGGRVERVVIGADESGRCLSLLPAGWLPRIAVYSAGYLGSAVAGALQLVLAFRWNLHRTVLVAMGAWVGVMGVVYAGDAFTVVFCVLASAVLVALGRWLRPSAARAGVMGLAVFTGLYALFDLRDDLWNARVRAGSDAALLAGSTHVPALVWAALWTLASAGVLLLGAWIALRGPRRRDGVGGEPEALAELRSLAASGMPRTTRRP